MAYLIGLLLTVTLVQSCSKRQNQEYSEDYVLIEFASRLEKDYHKTNDPSSEPPEDEFHRSLRQQQEQESVPGMYDSQDP